MFNNRNAQRFTPRFHRQPFQCIGDVLNILRGWLRPSEPFKQFIPQGWAPYPDELPAALPLEGIIQTNRDDKAYCADVERLKGHIRKGDIFQVVPSRCFSLPCPQP